MSKEIKLFFPTLDADATLTLLENDAPQSCAAVWQALAQPFEATLERAAGAPAVHVPTPVAAVPAENDDMAPMAGDVLLQAGGAGGARPVLSVTYDRARRDQPPQAAPAGNLCAVVSQNLAVIRQAAEAARQGPLAVRVQRVAPAPAPFVRDGIIQVGLVVESIEKSADMWWRLFGVGPWKVYSYGRPLLKFLNYGGEAADFGFRIALAWIGPLCIELIEPGEGVSIYHDFAREHGYGLHHLAVGVDDMREAIAQAAAAGLSVTQEGGGQGLDGSGHFAYLDSDRHVDAIIELVEFPKRRVKPDKLYPPHAIGQ